MNEETLKGKTVLIVDDENDLREIVASELEYLGSKVHQAENIREAMKLLETHKVDLVISDIRMPGGTGIDLLESIKKRGESAPAVVLITGFADITVEEAFHKGAEALLNKPFQLDELIKLVIRCTLPRSERFTEESLPKYMISVTDETPIRFGRGGVAVPIATPKKIDVGEVVGFDISSGHLQLKGTGICRWFRAPDAGSALGKVGIEFIYLTHESLQKFEDVLNHHLIIPYIPSFEA